MSEFIPPTTNEAWNDLIITSGIHIKWHNEAGRPDKYPSSQLDEMLFSHESKAATFKIKKEQAVSLLAALETLSSSQINLLLLSGAMGESISTVSEYETEKNADIEKYYALDRIVQLLKKEIEFRGAGTFPRDPIGTTYYIDSDNGNDSNDGLGSGGANAWLTISKFIASARSAGDIAICRRGTTANYGTAVTAVLSDGQTSNPITLEADYDNVWSDNAASAQTYTLVHGSKTAEASATITGVTAGEWVYNSTDSDDQRLFAYEVVSVSGTTLTLRHPFKGTSGATKTLTIMLANPIYGAGTNDVIYLHEDRYWRFSGIHIYSSYGEGAAFHKTNVSLKKLLFALRTITSTFKLPRAFITRF